jgi:DNA-binding NarL/FixJ family response regulator
MAIIHAPQPLPAPPAPAIPAAPPITLLLLEPHFLVRRTVSAVARNMRLADSREITTVEAADSLITQHAFDALFLSLDEEAAALDLMSRVRNGETRCAPDIPIAVTAAACDTPLALRLKHLDVRRLLLRPFKVKGFLDAISALRQLPAESHKAA